MWAKSPNHSYQFWGPNQQTRASGFGAKPQKTVATGFEVKLGETVNPCFEAKPRNLCSSSPRVWCRLHTTSPNLSIIWPPSTRPVLDHLRSSAPSLKLLARSSSLPAMLHLSPTHHETSKHISPHEIDSRVEPPKFPEFKFKPRQVNYSSQIKPRYWPLGFSQVSQFLV
jgi:hypothetical protein